VKLAKEHTISPTYSGVSISGHINWGYSEQLGGLVGTA